jgi:hypothetical protein
MDIIHRTVFILNIALFLFKTQSFGDWVLSLKHCVLNKSMTVFKIKTGR